MDNFSINYLNNKLQFEVSEIEYDTVLFISKGLPTDIFSIIHQSNTMKEAYGKCLKDLYRLLKKKIFLSLKFTSILFEEKTRTDSFYSYFIILLRD